MDSPLQQRVGSGRGYPNGQGDHCEEHRHRTAEGGAVYRRGCIGRAAGWSPSPSRGALGGSRGDATSRLTFRFTRSRSAVKRSEASRVQAGVRRVCVIQAERLDILAVCLLKIRKPTVPAAREPSKMLIFELWTISGLPKANNVMKMDMVNPIPPRKPAPMICLHDTSPGNWDKPSLTAKTLNRAIPSGLPKNKPAKMPMLLDVTNPSIQFPVRAMPVFAKAKSGMMRKPGLCKKCCNLQDGDSPSPRANGMAKARRTLLWWGGYQNEHEVPHNKSRNEVKGSQRTPRRFSTSNPANIPRAKTRYKNEKSST